MKKQQRSLPEAEVIECLMQGGWSFDETMNMKRDLKWDCYWKCWNTL